AFSRPLTLAMRSRWDSTTVRAVSSPPATAAAISVAPSCQISRSMSILLFLCSDTGNDALGWPAGPIDRTVDLWPSSLPALRVDQAVLHGEHGQRGPGGHAGLLVDVDHMRVDGTMNSSAAMAFLDRP